MTGTKLDATDAVGDVELFDSHCHVPWEGMGAEAIAEARGAGVRWMVTVGTDRAQSQAAIAVAAAHDDVWATVGLHPHDAKDGVATIRDLIDDTIVAIGECGLDYHYDHSPRDVQRAVFAEQIALAHEHELALVIHTREAWDDTFAILEGAGVPARTIFHCFTGGEREAERALATGAFLSFSGIVTFKTAADVQAAARSCPLDRMLIETDSPYLAPVPHRGRPNRPALLGDVAAGVARVTGQPLTVVGRATAANAHRAFGLQPS